MGLTTVAAISVKRIQLLMLSVASLHVASIYNIITLTVIHAYTIMYLLYSLTCDTMGFIYVYIYQKLLLSMESLSLLAAVPLVIPDQMSE